MFFAPGQLRGGGDPDTTLHFGGGGKYISSSGAGFGAEMGIGGPKTDFGSNDVGIFSLNGYFQKKVGDSKAEPFVTAGYSAFFGHDAPHNWFNFGGGVDYWAKEKLGLMLEFRDHIHHESAGTFQVWEVRFGLAFR